MSAVVALDAADADFGGLTEMLDRSQELLHDAPQDAERLLTLARDRADQNGDDASSARACYLLARVRVERGELHPALDLIDEARSRWLASGDDISALRTGLGRMQVLDDLGRHREAASVGAALLAELEELTRRPGQGATDPDALAWLQAAALENYGVATSYVGEHERAIEAYERAETTYAQLGRDAERARPMANRGVELLGLGRAREALAVLRSAADTFEQSGDRLWGAKCRADVARAHRQLGQYTESLRVLAQARTTLEELDAAPELARLRLALATTYLEIGVYDAAAAEALAASSLTRSAGMVHDTATAQFTLALSYFESGALSRAATALAEAAELFEQVEDRRSRTELRLIEAEFAASGGDAGRAAAHAETAVAESRAGGWPALLVRSLLCLSDHAAPDLAAEALDEARPLAQELGLPVLSYELDLRRGRRELTANRVASGETLFRQAIGHVASLGTALPDRMLRRAFRARTVTAHDDLIDLLVSRNAHGDHAEAAHLADVSKAQALRERIGDAGAPRAGVLSGELAQLQADLNATYLAMSEAADAPQLRRLHDRATALQQHIAARQLREVGVAEHDLPAAAPAAVAEPDARTTVAYHLAGGDVIAFVSGGGHLHVRRLGAVQAVDRHLEMLSAQWHRFQVGGGFAQRHQAALLATASDTMKTLHELLLAPIADLVSEMGGDELVVVPHRQLNNVPFHGLYDGDRPLIDRWTISVAPTREQLPGFDTDRTNALVLAVPDQRAPAVADEAAAVAAVLPSACVLTGESATSDALTELAPDCGILHIACHGLFRSGNPMFSALRLADRWVTATELAQLDLRGTLVVLSACESGRQDDASEPVGLAWALLAAGARDVVVSRWVVDDRGAAALMGDMHKHISAGQTPAVALRAAQLAAEQRTPHPFHWAPFSHVTTMRGAR